MSKTWFLKEEDEGPFWLNENDKRSLKKDILSGPIFEKDLSKCELLIELRKTGYDTTKKRYLKNELIEICKLNNIATTKKIQKTEEGWVGKAKGMLQILYERGYIDKEKVSHPRSMPYSKNGKKVHYTNGDSIPKENYTPSTISYPNAPILSMKSPT